MAGLVPVELFFSGEDEEKRVDQLLDQVGASDTRRFDGMVEAAIPPESVPAILESGIVASFPAGTGETGAAVPAGMASADPETREIPPADREVIDRFAKRSRKLKRTGKGRGLGLVVLKGLRRTLDPMIDGVGRVVLRGVDLGVPIGDGLETVISAAETALSAELLPRDVYLVTLSRPLAGERLGQIHGLGAAVIGTEAPNVYRMEIDAVRLDEVRRLPFVTSIRRYGLEDTITPSFVKVLHRLDQAGQSGEEGLESAIEAPLFDVILHRPDDVGAVAALVESAGAKVVERSRSALRIQVAPEAPVLAAVANLPSVRRLSPYLPPSYDVDRSRALMGVASASPPATDPWTGAGETIAVFDSGVDSKHADLTHVLALSARSGTADDQSGHGTHVAGIIGGSGKTSGGAIRGVAPGARLVSFGITNPQGAPDVPPDLGDLLELALSTKDDSGTALGARILNLSWSFPYLGDYEVYGEQIDQFVWDHPEVLVVVASGNKGQASAGKHEPGTVGVPATAKNVLSVGACASDRQGFGQHWGELDGSRFGTAPVKDELVAGDSDRIAALSGRGPTHSLAVKPDLVAPGTLIVSARAGAATIPFLKVPAVLEREGYGYLNGTSMAAPAIAGAAALVRQLVRARHGIADPSSALIKAILVASAKRLPGANENAINAGIGYPDFDQGFGRPWLADVLPDGAGQAKLALAVEDVDRGSARAVASHQPIGSTIKSSHQYRLKVPADSATPLRVVLAWVDPPSPSVVNQLVLSVQGPDGSQVLGNHEHRGALPPYLFHVDPLPATVITERFNTVKVVVVAAPKAGTYRITVRATDVSRPPQGYSLAAVGEFEGGFEFLL
jgi:serine protease AprX